MLNQLSRKLKPQHLLILIAIIIIAIIVTAFRDHYTSSENILDEKKSQTLIVIPPPATAPTPPPQATHENAVTTLNQPVPIQAKISPPPAFKTSWQTVKVKPGDTTSEIFSRLGINYTQLAQIIQLPVAKSNLTHLKIGQEIHFKFNKKQQLQRVKYALNDISTLHINRHGNHFTAKISNKPLETHLVFREFTLHGSLAATIKNAGLGLQLYSQVQRIFKTSVNFARNIHPGDRFEVLFQEFYLNGHKYRPGNVMLASLNGKKQHVTAIRYTDPQGKSDYYTPKGDSLRVAMFLKSPLHYDHISSFFSLHRLDPYIHKYHPHLGIDYAASAGTPIHSIGDGVIALRGWYSGYGNAVIVKYGNKYKALYGHMQRFAANQHIGEHIAKGQVIGYVGHTGWSTGDHLHFGWYVNDIPYDPLKFKTTQPMPVPFRYRHDFLAESRSLINQLELYESTKFAENKIDDSARRS